MLGFITVMVIMADPLDEPSIFLQILGTSPTLKVLDTLLTGRELDFSKKDIAESAEISWNTLASIWGYLAEKGIIVRTRKIGKQEMYTLNKNNELVGLLERFYDSLINYVIESSGPSKGIELAKARN
jgi:predicted transcriptional regulator